MSLDYYHRRKVHLNGWEYLLDDEERTAWIAKGKIKRVRRYRIPTSVVIEGKEYRIESVEMGAFRHTKTLRHLVIPDGIQYVDEYNFSFSKSLRSIYIGKDVDYISSWLFHNNPNLRTFVISPDNPHLFMEDGIVYSKDGTVALCAIFQPRHLHIREGVTLIENVAFWWNPRLEQVDFPASLRKIGDNSFAGCPRLKSIVLPEGFEECVVQSFEENKGLESVDLPSTMSMLQWDTFLDCPNLHTMRIRTKDVLPIDLYSEYDKDEFDKMVSQYDIFVPSHLIDAYRHHPYWGKCRSINSLDAH